MTVRLITRADDELYSLINTAGKFGRAAKILTTLERECTAAPDDVEVLGRLALAQMAALVGMAGDMGAHAIVTEAIESCGRVLALDPDHWFARYARARLRTLAPSSYGSYTVQSDPGWQQRAGTWSIWSVYRRSCRRRPTSPAPTPQP